MYEAPTAKILNAESRFWNASRAKLIFVCVTIVWATAIFSRLGLILTKNVELHPQELFLYIFMGSPVLVAIYAGVKERVYPYRVTLIISFAFSVISFLIALEATESAAVIRTGVILAFVKEGISYAAFLVLVALVAHKLAKRSNPSFKRDA